MVVTKHEYELETRAPCYATKKLVFRRNDENKKIDTGDIDYNFNGEFDEMLEKSGIEAEECFGITNKPYKFALVKRKKTFFFQLRTGKKKVCEMKLKKELHDRFVTEIKNQKL